MLIRFNIISNKVGNMTEINKVSLNGVHPITMGDNGTPMMVVGYLGRAIMAFINYITDKEGGLDASYNVVKLIDRVIQKLELDGRKFNSYAQSLPLFQDFVDSIGVVSDVTSLFELELDGMGNISGFHLSKESVEIFGDHNWIKGVKKVLIFILHAGTIPILVGDRLKLFQIGAVAIEKIGKGLSITFILYCITAMVDDVKDLINGENSFCTCAKINVHFFDMLLTFGTIASGIGPAGVLGLKVAVVVVEIIVGIVEQDLKK